jgi:hypothetical protein
MTKFGQMLLFSAALGAVTMASGAALADDPLGGRAPWSFTPQNRAAIAVAIKQVEDGGGNGSGAGTIVCGGTSGASGEGSAGAGSSATANSSCIIINNSAGAQVNNPQESHGNQDSESEVKTKKGGSIDEVSAILGGQKNGL